MSPQLSQVCSNRYVGVPYVLGGRSPTPGWDCYGLLYHVMREHLAVEVPAYAVGYSAAPRGLAGLVAGTLRGWQRLPMPVAGCGVVVRIGGLPVHCGLMLSESAMMHCLQGQQTVIERLDGPKWASRIEGFYSWN